MLVFGFRSRGRPRAQAAPTAVPGQPSPISGRLNPVFTRIVNHCVIVVGLKGDPLALTGPRGGVFVVRCSRTFMSNMKWRLEKKSIPCSMLGRFVRVRPRLMRAWESDFVNHALVKFRLDLSQRRFRGPPLRRADLSPARRGRGLACAYC